MHQAARQPRARAPRAASRPRDAAVVAEVQRRRATDASLAVEPRASRCAARRRSRPIPAREVAVRVAVGAVVDQAAISPRRPRASQIEVARVGLGHPSSVEAHRLTRLGVEDVAGPLEHRGESRSSSGTQTVQARRRPPRRRRRSRRGEASGVAGSRRSTELKTERSGAAGIDRRPNDVLDRSSTLPPDRSASSLPAIGAAPVPTMRPRQLEFAVGSLTASARSSSRRRSPTIARSTRSSAASRSLSAAIAAAPTRRRPAGRARGPASRTLSSRISPPGRSRAQALLVVVGVAGLVGVDEGEVEAPRAGQSRAASRAPGRRGSRPCRRARPRSIQRWAIAA